MLGPWFSLGMNDSVSALLQSKNRGKATRWVLRTHCCIKQGMKLIFFQFGDWSIPTCLCLALFSYADVTWFFSVLTLLCVWYGLHYAFCLLFFTMVYYSLGNHCTYLFQVLFLHVQIKNWICICNIFLSLRRSLVWCRILIILIVVNPTRLFLTISFTSRVLRCGLLDIEPV